MLTSQPSWWSVEVCLGFHSSLCFRTPLSGLVFLYCVLQAHFRCKRMINTFLHYVMLHWSFMPYLLVLAFASVSACSQTEYPRTAPAPYKSGLWGECANSKCWAAARSRAPQCPGHWCPAVLAIGPQSGRTPTAHLRSGLAGASSSMELWRQCMIDIVAKCRSTNTSPCIFV